MSVPRRESPTAARAEPPTAFDAHIGNGLDGVVAVEWDGTQLLWRFRDQEESVEPTPEAWVAFWRALDRLGVWRWDESYETPGVCDGTFWGVTIERGEQRVRAAGANGYPDGRGPEPGRGFRAFCKAVSTLAGGRTFR